MIFRKESLSYPARRSEPNREKRWSKNLNLRYLSIWVAIIGATSSVGLWSCSPFPTSETEESGLAFVPLAPLGNKTFQVVNMAAAHGALTVEIEVDAGANLEAIARTVIEPVQSRYGEILVYFYDRDETSLLPLQRVQWSPAGGYEALSYQTPRPTGMPKMEDAH